MAGAMEAEGGGCDGAAARLRAGSLPTGTPPSDLTPSGLVAALALHSDRRAATGTGPPSPDEVCGAAGAAAASLPPLGTHAPWRPPRPPPPTSPPARGGGALSPPPSDGAARSLNLDAICF